MPGTRIVVSGYAVLRYRTWRLINLSHRRRTSLGTSGHGAGTEDSRR